MKRTLALIATLILVSGFAAAREGSGAPAYLLVIDGVVETSSLGSWTEAVATLVEAHDVHPDGAHWATFRELTGGPDVQVRFFRGFSKLADLDGWIPNRRILVDVLGPVEGGAVKDALARGVESADRVATLVDELSRPWNGAEPPEYLWVATVRVADGKMTEYAALAKRVRRAFDEYTGDLRWLCYANAIGGPGSELTYYYPFDAFAEVDGWPSRREVLTAALGEHEGARLAAAIEAISETTTSLWKLEPELSRIGHDCEF